MTWFLHLDLSGFFSLKHVHTQTEAKYGGWRSSGEGRLIVSHWKEPITPIWHCSLATLSGLTYHSRLLPHSGEFFSQEPLCPLGNLASIRGLRPSDPCIGGSLTPAWSQKIPQGFWGLAHQVLSLDHCLRSLSLAADRGFIVC